MELEDDRGSKADSTSRFPVAAALAVLARIGFEDHIVRKALATNWLERHPHARSVSSVGEGSIPNFGRAFALDKY